MLPLAICATAMVAALLIVSAMLLGVARPGHATEAPPWSGSQPPPGAVGLSPERSIVDGLATANPVSGQR